MEGLAIRKITNELGLKISLQVIQEAFSTVAASFALTPETAPTHPAFIDEARLGKLRNKGVVFFGVFLETQQIGFVAVEKSNEAVYYLEKLAVLPPYRRQGAGGKIINFVCDYVRQMGGTKISIGIMNENIELKRWYQAYGFLEIESKKYQHLPFAVCFMEKNL
ncbi:GNAT family N-acetyltransferase [Sporomusa sp.]|uniref:GNAT family N-acetyltransferase n=1 Tax=Sporomusa sp. TaxID=2078658 RepID=UPI002D17E4F8|nr:GNAT family N-acetyltransferase [Sporomusa sp.]HWR08245.1 GNAT family N-acetyltransferase [Sporomusa sp.]